MERPAQFMYEGTRTFNQQDVTLEIVVIQLFKYGLFEVLGRDKNSLRELHPLYLRSCIIEQRIQHSEVESLMISGRTKFDPKNSLDEEELYDLIVRASIFNDIADRLSLEKKDDGDILDSYEMEYLPAPGDLEFGSDKARLAQLICDDPYRFGAPAPYKEIPVVAQEKKLFCDLVQASKPAPTPTGLSAMLHKLSTFFLPSMTYTSKSERSLQTDSNSTVCLSQASGESAKSVSPTLRNKPSKIVDLDCKSPVVTSAAQKDLAYRVLDRLKKLPDISEAPSEQQPDPTNNVAGLVHHQPAQDSSYKGVTAEQLAAYFTYTESTNESCNESINKSPSVTAVRARIPYRQYPCLQPPKCVANLNIYTHPSDAVAVTSGRTQDVSSAYSGGAVALNSAGYSMNIDETDTVPLFAPQIKQKTHIPLLNLTYVTNACLGDSFEPSYNVIDPPVKPQSFLMNMLLGGSFRVGVEPL